MEIKGKIAIVTGASDGIGREIAIKLAARGARVVLAARSDDKIAALAGELEGSLAVHTDMADEAQIHNLIDRTVEVFGRIDLLVNNAGQGMYSPVEKTVIDDYRKIINLNVIGTLLAMQFAIPHMRTQGGGMILNISSMVSKNYYPNLGAYASTKYALNALSLTARDELKGNGIVVSVFHPKLTATGFGKNAMGSHPDYGNRARNTSGMQIDTAEDVAEKVMEQIESEAAEANM